MMSIIQQNHRAFPSLGSMFSDFFDTDSFFTYPFKKDVPAVNVKENATQYEIELAAPGMQKEDFKVELGNGILTIKAEKKEERKEEKERFTRKEFSYTSFQRSFSLPDSVNVDAIEANYENGILKLQIGKKEEVITPSVQKEIRVS